MGGRGANSSIIRKPMSKLTDADTKTYKLSPEQLKQYNKAIDYLNLALESKDFKDYYVKTHTQYDKGKQNYNDIVKRETEFFEKNEESLTRDYKKYYDQAINKNYTLATMSSTTARALEKKGLIKIISLGGRTPDTIQIIRRRNK